MVSEKIKITKAEFEEMYQWTDEKEDSYQEGLASEGDQVTITEHEETWEEMTERKDKEKYGT